MGNIVSFLKCISISKDEIDGAPLCITDDVLKGIAMHNILSQVKVAK